MKLLRWTAALVLCFLVGCEMLDGVKDLYDDWQDDQEDVVPDPEPEPNPTPEPEPEPEPEPDDGGSTVYPVPENMPIPANLRIYITDTAELCSEWEGYPYITNVITWDCWAHAATNGPVRRCNRIGNCWRAYLVTTNTIVEFQNKHNKRRNNILKFLD